MYCSITEFVRTHYNTSWFGHIYNTNTHLILHWAVYHCLWSAEVSARGLKLSVCHMTIIAPLHIGVIVFIFKLKWTLPKQSIIPNKRIWPLIEVYFDWLFTFDIVMLIRLRMCFKHKFQVLFWQRILVVICNSLYNLIVDIWLIIYW